MPVDVTLPSAAARPATPPGPLLAFWRSFRENRGAVLGLIVVSIVIFIAIFAHVLAPHDPLEQFRGFTKLPPIWVEGGNWTYPLGTDPLGRDMLSRLMYGSRISLFIGLSVMSVSMIVGVVLGLAAAWFGGILDVISRGESGGNLREIVRVAAVISADDDHQVQLLVFEPAHGILAILGCAADRVEGIKSFCHFFTAVPAGHGNAQHFSNIERL